MSRLTILVASDKRGAIELFIKNSVTKMKIFLIKCGYQKNITFLSAFSIKKTCEYLRLGLGQTQNRLLSSNGIPCIWQIKKGQPFCFNIKINIFFRI